MTGYTCSTKFCLGKLQHTDCSWWIDARNNCSNRF